MEMIEKLRIIESDAVPKEGAKIEAMSTSIKITHTCGCVLVEHFAAGKPNMRREENPEKYDGLLAERKYFIELCNEHNPRNSMAEIIKTDGTRHATAPANGEYFTLEEMQAAVGGLVEIIELDDKQSMILNEEGKMLDLEYNEAADDIFHRHFSTFDYIVGDVLLCENELIR